MTDRDPNYTPETTDATEAPAHVAACGYKIVFHAAPREPGEPPPETLEELRHRVKVSLFRSGAAVFEFIALALELPGNILRGLSAPARPVRSLPPKLQVSAELATELADVRETRRQATPRRGTGDCEAPDRFAEVAAAIERRTGVKVRYGTTTDGRVFLVAVREEAVDGAAEIARRLLEDAE